MEKLFMKNSNSDDFLFDECNKNACDLMKYGVPFSVVNRLTIRTILDTERKISYIRARRG